MTAAAIRNVEKLSQADNFLESPSWDLLWSDPRAKVTEFEDSPRGCGVLFGREAVERFLRVCPGAFRIVRSHESCQDGFDWPFTQEGPVLTVFSSCDYCNTGNDAAVATITDSDNSAKCVAFAPIIGQQIEKKRVIFPEWLMREAGAGALDVAQNDRDPIDVEIQI
jgi:hypothetical protein